MSLLITLKLISETELVKTALFLALKTRFLWHETFLWLVRSKDMDTGKWSLIPVGITKELIVLLGILIQT